MAHIEIPEPLAQKAEDMMEEQGYKSLSEFARQAIREKIDDGQ